MLQRYNQNSFPCSVRPDNLGPGLVPRLISCSFQPHRQTKPLCKPQNMPCFFLLEPFKSAIPSAQSTIPFPLSKPLFQFKDSAESHHLWQIFLEWQGESTRSAPLYSPKAPHTAQCTSLQLLSPDLFNISFSHQMRLSALL